MKRFILVPGLLLALGIYSPAQENTISPGENLIVDGVPKILASLAETIGRYTENRDAFPTDWHPKRREMLIATRFGNTIQQTPQFGWSRLGAGFCELHLDFPLRSLPGLVCLQ